MFLSLFKFHKLENVIYLTGTKFAPIDFIKRKNSTIRNSLLVSMGMFDRKGITLKIVKVLIKTIKKNQLALKLL